VSCAAAIFRIGVGPGEIAFWQVTPRASIAQIYSDNIEQARRGEENSEAVTDLNVGFRLDRDGPRGSGRFDYNLQGVAFWDESDSDVFQQFTGAGDVALAPERVFVEGSVDFRQRAVDRNGSLSDNLTLNADRTDVLSLRISPYLVQRFEDAAVGELRYAYSRVDYGSEADEDDSETNRFLATLDSGPMFGRIGWGLSYDYSKEDFDDGSSFESQVVEALGALGNHRPHQRVRGRGIRGQRIRTGSQPFVARRLPLAGRCHLSACSADVR
jgi:uncharacterized protein (PEP-CTERM system associated)